MGIRRSEKDWLIFPIRKIFKHLNVNVLHLFVQAFLYALYIQFVSDNGIHQEEASPASAAPLRPETTIVEASAAASSRQRPVAATACAVPPPASTEQLRELRRRGNFPKLQQRYI